MKTNGSC